MCKRISGVTNGPDLKYQPYKAYIFSFTGTLEVTNKKYEVECWENGIWINMGRAVSIEIGCPFRIIHKKVIEPPPVCTVIDVDQVKVAA